MNTPYQQTIYIDNTKYIIESEKGPEFVNKWIKLLQQNVSSPVELPLDANSLPTDSISSPPVNRNASTGQQKEDDAK